MDFGGNLVEAKLVDLGVAESPFEAELLAIKEGLRASRTQEHERVILVTDCLEASNAI